MYIVMDNCPGCMSCKDVCPVGAISVGRTAVISDKCIECGVCQHVCPINLIREKPLEDIPKEDISKDEINISKKKEA